MGYKTVIIDDNPATVDSLRATIDWDGIGLTLAGCASTGLEGMQLIMVERPEIIITDINMPETDGLTMIEKVRESLPHSRVIFITGYDKFQYASRAIKLSAFDFILKPIDNDELTGSLKRAVSTLNLENAGSDREGQYSAVLKRAQLISSLADPDTIQKTGNFPFLNTPPARYCFAIASSPDGMTGPVLQRMSQLTGQDRMEVVSAIYSGDMVLFCSLKNADDSWHYAVRKLAEKLTDALPDITVAVGDIHEASSDYYLAYQEARRTLLWHNINYKQPGIEFFHSELFNSSENEKLLGLKKVCEDLAENTESLSADEIWNTIMDKSHGRPRIIRLMLFLFYSALSSREDFADYEQENLVILDMTGLDTVEEDKKWLFALLQSLRSEPSSSRNLSLAKDVIRYINGHVTEGLDLDKVAKEFYVSPNYLSTLIRKETGITYRQHVIRAKMNVAKQMLDDTRMSIEEIAYAVHYENYISFYNAFKKSEGITPTEYRYRK